MDKAKKVKDAIVNLQTILHAEYGITAGVTLDIHQHIYETNNNIDVAEFMQGFTDTPTEHFLPKSGVWCTMWEDKTESFMGLSRAIAIYHK